MTRSIFWRLVWKEYRLQRALWLSIVMLTMLLLWLVFATISPRDSTPILFWLALGLPASYCLGCGATLFAGEQEGGTYEFQRGLPVRAWLVFAAKMVFALVSAALMFALLWLLATWLSGWTLHPVKEFRPLPVLQVLSLFGLQVFLWATLFSLLMTRVLPAAILGVMAASVTVQIMADWVSPGFSTNRYWLITPHCAVIAAVLALVDCWLGAGWFRQRCLFTTRLAVRTKPSASAATFSSRFHAPERLAMFGRLVWQHGRQSALVSLAVLAAALIPLMVIAGRWEALPEHGRTQYDPTTLYFGILPLMVAIPLLGLCAFLADQWRHGYRFLADRGVPPKYIWLSRQFVALLPMALVLPPLVALAYLLAPRHWSPALEERISYPLMSMGYVLGYLVIGFTAGQLCSMFFSSSLLAGLFAIAMTVLLAGWGWLMLFWQVDWLWSVLPIPLALLLASRLRTRDWLLERNTCRAWLLPALALAVPSVAILAAVPLYRIYQVPLFHLDRVFSTAELTGPMTVDEKATRGLYRQAAEAYRNLQATDWRVETAQDRAKRSLWIAENRKTIELALLASRGPLIHPIDDLPQTNVLHRVPTLLMESAAKLEAEGKLDAALAQYLAALRIVVQFRRCDLSSSFSAANQYRHYDDSDEVQIYARLTSWAARPQQTSARILAALRQLEQATRHASVAEAIKVQYVRLQRALQGDLTMAWPGQRLPPLTLLWLRLPWERERALRLLNFQVLFDDGAHGNKTSDRGPELRKLKFRLDQKKDGELLYALARQLGLTPISYDWEEPDTWYRCRLTLEEGFRAVETARQAARLILALDAWKLQHGELPKSLDPLVGPYFDRLPADPYSGAPFRYFREGLGIPLTWNQPLYGWDSSTARGNITANVPFIWSIGAKIFWHRDPKEDDIRRCLIYTDRATSSGVYRSGRWLHSDWFRSPNSQYDIWESGWPFLIP